MAHLSTTAEQVEDFRQEYRSLLCSTKETNHDSVTDAINRIYFSFNLPEPVIVWLDSIGQLEQIIYRVESANTCPLEVGTRQYRAIQRIESNIYSSVAPAVRSYCLKAATRGTHLATIADRLNQAVRAASHWQTQVPNERLADLLLQAEVNSIGDFFMPNLCRSTGTTWLLRRAYPHGEIIAAWSSLIQLGYTEFFLRMLQEKPRFLSESLAPYITMAREAHAYLPYKRVCFISQRPLTIAFDSDWMLHSTKGPCISYWDTYSVYALRGLVLHPDVVLRKITVKTIQEERNAEVRRVMLDQYGEANFLQDARAKVIDQSEFGKLYRCEMPGDEPLVMLEVLNSTPEPDGSFRTYHLRVPPHSQTAKQAVAWTFHLGEEDYDPSQET